MIIETCGDRICWLIKGSLQKLSCDNTHVCNRHRLNNGLLARVFDCQTEIDRRIESLLTQSAIKGQCQ